MLRFNTTPTEKNNPKTSTNYKTFTCQKPTNLWTAVAITIINMSVQKSNTGMDTVCTVDNISRDRPVCEYQASWVVAFAAEHAAVVAPCSVIAVHGAPSCYCPHRTSILGRDPQWWGGGMVGIKHRLEVSPFFYALVYWVCSPGGVLPACIASRVRVMLW